MKKISKYIEIVQTQNSGFRSMRSKACRMIYESLRKYYTLVEVSTVNTQAELVLLAAKQPDVVFLGFKRLPEAIGGIWLPDFLDQKGIAYTGSAASALALDSYKENAKLQVLKAGLPTAPFFTAWPGQFSSAADLPLPFPFFIKPPNSGDSMGIGPDSVVHTFQDFEQKVESIFIEFSSGALIEQYLTGREYSVAILADDSGIGLQAMPVELSTEQNASGDRILDERIKAADSEQVVAIADMSIRIKVNALAKAVFQALGGRDFGRIDIRMDGTGSPYFLEANFIPGLATGYFTRACQINAGMDYDTMIQRIVNLALSRVAPLEKLATT